MGCNEADVVRSARPKGKKVDAKIQNDFENLLLLEMNLNIDFFINNSGQFGFEEFWLNNNTQCRDQNQSTHKA